MRRIWTVDKQLVADLAGLAGLQDALADFPEDVAIAATIAANARRSFTAPADPAVEPWPPMRVPAP
jgi:hypothetical protein